MTDIYPKLRQPNDLDTTALSKDEQIGIAYERDPLVYDKISVGLFKIISDGAAYITAPGRSFNIKGYVFHGNGDRIIDCEATKTFAAQNKEMVEWKEWDNVYHEPHNDLEKEAVIQSMITWLDEQ
jgi:alpha-beta hydrolase superfamily lysophospholipase